MRRIAVLLFFAIAVALACNTPDIVSGPPASTTQTPIPVSGTPSVSPGPTPQVGQLDCGNADLAYLDQNDPWQDDSPGQSDSYVCIWLCTAVPDADHPHEVEAEYDFDGYAAIEAGPVEMPCYSYVPVVP